MSSFEWKGVEYFFHIGRNQYENSNLIDGANPWDVWFHVDGCPSSHVILEVEEGSGGLRNIPLTVLKRGAILCKQHSKSKSIANCKIMYTLVMNLEKTNIPGRVIVHGNYKYITL
jgi:predicted ribosome quality control (RQC) complex YloA/Tae2 family protein